MALRGNLRDFSLPDVFQLVQLSRKTGVLRIRDNGAEGSIWFRDGDVFFAQSNWQSEPLGQRMVSAQKITPSALAKALEIQKSEPANGRRLGQILIDEGYVTDKVLEAFVQEQIQDTIFDLMRWDSGEFDFELLPDVVHEDIGLSVSIENIVMEGSRRLEEWNRIKKKVPSMDMVFKMATAPGEGTFEISLKPTEWNLLLLVDGTRTVSELAVQTTRTDFEVARIIYGLFSAGLLEVASDDEVERLRAERAEQQQRLAAMHPESEMAERSRVETEPVSAPEEVAPEVERAKNAEIAEAPATEQAVSHEEPEFLSAPATPNADDLAAFEQMMSAVLTPSVPSVAPTPEPAPEPALESEPEPEPALEPEPEPEPALEPEPEPEPALEPEPEPEPALEPEPLLDIAADLDIEPVDMGVASEPVADDVAEMMSAPTAEEALLAGASDVDVDEDAEAPIEFGALTPDEYSQIPTPPVADDLMPESGAVQSEPEVRPAAHVPTGDLEADLLALGLGELPQEYAGEPVGAEPTVEVAEAVITDAPARDESESPLVSETELGFTVEPEPVLEPGAIAEPDVIAEPEAIEAPLDMSDVPAEMTTGSEETLSDLLESLEVETSASEEAPAPPTQEPSPTESDTGVSDDLDELLRSLGSDEGAGESESPSGVISTDAYLAEFEDNVGLSSGLSDEITALTGAGGGTTKARPTATVNKLPEPGEGAVLHRDSTVDRGLVMKIIEGIEKL